ncbi:hypothetical protein BJ166DRAFT_340877 [Pestalotiopsis sp. NC0098]|nr:hypothetical protein BJ166DRAFT_340877 [Pestalotiopsis sp. NC0098]
MAICWPLILPRVWGIVIYIGATPHSFPPSPALPLIAREERTCAGSAKGIRQEQRNGYWAPAAGIRKQPSHRLGRICQLLRCTLSTSGIPVVLGGPFVKKSWSRRGGFIGKCGDRLV